MSKVMRSVKNVTKSSIQVKVRNATSNEPWGPTGTEMGEIAQMTFGSTADFYEIMDMLDKRLNDKGKNWRHVLKALKVLDYCLHEGSELVVTWARKNVFVIKTLREFVYNDDNGQDVGLNVRVSAKELTALILDEDRLRAERSDRKTWKSRVQGLEEFRSSSPQEESSRRPRRVQRAQRSDEEDAEYRLAIEASKHQEEEDRRKRESRNGAQPDDDDLAKAIKLSREEEELRRRELEDNNANSLFDDDPVQNPAMSNYTGYNGGYQQGGAVDWSANPIQQADYTGQYNPNGYQNQNQYPNGFNSQPTGFDPYGQQQVQQQPFQPQPTGYNPYAQQTAFQQQPEPVPQMPMQTGTNNPWATNNQAAQSQMPMPTGSNNPFATSFNRPSTSSGQRTQPTLGVLREQKSLSQFNNHPSFNPATSFSTPQPAPQKEQDPHQARLNALLASGEGMDTFGNTGNLRIPAQHTAPGTFVNSAAHGLGRINEQATGAPGNNPFLSNQFTGMPQTSYGGAGQNGFGGRQVPAATGPAGAFGGSGAGMGNNPFGQRQQGQQGGGQGNLIEF